MNTIVFNVNIFVTFLLSLFIKAAKVNAVMCEVNIKTYQKRLLKLEELHKEKMNRVQLQVDRYVKNLKNMNKTIDDLLEEKEAIHLQLKEIYHYGLEQCEFCKNYFKPSGLARHKSACASKPVNKKIKKHEKEITDEVAKNEARKAALEKELAALKKKAQKAPKPKPKPEPEPELEE